METSREDASYVLHPAASPAIPVVISVPHCGAAFPDEVRASFREEHLSHPDDTDWFVNDLYDFAPAMGATLIHSHYCRYVIDLNRDPDSKPLYSDGRTITGLVSETTFLNEPLYREGATPELDEIHRRRDAYYWPYHQALEAHLDALRREFGAVLLWEAHSIRRRVPTIRSAPFPDMILGDADGASAHPDLSQLALQMLHKHTGRQVNHNDPFKGGYITRAFGRPDNGIHALQLEMAKDLYMDDDEREYASSRAATIREALKLTIKALAVGIMALAG